MKKIYICFIADLYGTLVFDQNYQLITYVHENDGTWSHYFDMIINHFGCEVEYPKIDWTGLELGPDRYVNDANTSIIQARLRDHANKLGKFL